GGNKTSAKLVDLDTQAQMFSEVWGWRIHINNYLSADFTPVPVQYTWKKMTKVRGGVHSLGAVHQSVLSNIHWLDNNETSRFFNELQSMMGNSAVSSQKLSIRYNMDMYEGHRTKSNFTYGRIVDFKNSQLRHLRKHMLKDKENKIQGKKFQPRYPNFDFEYVKHHNTIGGFYNHILNSLGHLTDCGKNNSIFTGDEARQVDFWSVHGHKTIVTDYYSAVEAVKVIVEQGEGSSPCNPMSWSNGTTKDLSHYFLFYSITENRQIVVLDPKSKQKGNMADYSKLCNGTYFFIGNKIPFDADGVWPMIPNPQMSKYKKDSRAYFLADQFNKAYTKLLKSLDYVFNGHPDKINDALGLMFSVQLHLKNLVGTPIHPDGDPDIGPNAGPTWDFVP
ncbi:hypothetical protein QZH41_019042, partial [Actinostola sp. cb2023]